MRPQSPRLSPLPHGFVARRPIDRLTSKRTPRHVWSQLFGDGLLTIRATLQRFPYRGGLPAAPPSRASDELVNTPARTGFSIGSNLDHPLSASAPSDGRALLFPLDRCVSL